MTTALIILTILIAMLAISRLTNRDELGSRERLPSLRNSRSRRK